MSKRRRTLTIWMLGVGVMLAGCTFPMRQVPFEARPADWESLAGAWRGEYWTPAYDRHGTIAFNLAASTEAASGEVLMISDRSGGPYVRSAPNPGAVLSEPITELLAIRFVRARDGQIDGHLEPYWDPDRRCQASATFLGWVDGNRISGTFSSRCVDDTTRILNGRWAAHRNR
jgi:hypothetical protein